MAAKHRVFLTGSDRNEAEHVLGFKLPVDDSDPRFVLLTDEQEDAVRKFPPGAPANRGQNWAEAEQIIKAQKGEGPLHEAFGSQSGSPEVAESASAVPAKASEAEANAEVAPKKAESK